MGNSPWGFESPLPHKVDLVTQSVEYYTFNVGVEGSSPSGVTNISLAQLVVHLTLNQRVPSSSLGGDTEYFHSSGESERLATNQKVGGSSPSGGTTFVSVEER